MRTVTNTNARPSRDRGAGVGVLTGHFALAKRSPGGATRYGQRAAAPVGFVRAMRLRYEVMFAVHAIWFTLASA